MESSDQIKGSRDGPGAGDHDTPFQYGNPTACLTTMVLARLLIMRGEVMDYRAGTRGGAADGDLELYRTIPHTSGLLLVDDSRP